MRSAPTITGDLLFGVGLMLFGISVVAIGKHLSMEIPVLDRYSLLSGNRGLVIGILFILLSAVVFLCRRIMYG